MRVRFAESNKRVCLVSHDSSARFTRYSSQSGYGRVADDTPKMWRPALLRLVKTKRVYWDE
jgi:hypothetical protein